MSDIAGFDERDGRTVAAREGMQGPGASSIDSPCKEGEREVSEEFEARKRRFVSGSFQNALKQSSERLLSRQSSIIDILPESPAGWAVLLSALLSAGLYYEVKLQKSLTNPPITMGQLPPGTCINSVYQKLTATDNSILSRPIQPSLLVGTRGTIASSAAYLFGSSSSKSAKEHLRFREVVTSTQDGAKIAVDWEIPLQTKNSSPASSSATHRKREILDGKIHQPVVIILHGINNDSNFGYMRSLQCTCAKRGWNAAAMNFRGCGGLPLATPRSYNAAYTGDLRNLVLQISGRMADKVPVFLVGNSLGANLLAKYLGEEGLSGTLPACVAGAVSLGNPMLFNSEKIAFPYNYLIGAARKLKYMEHWRIFFKMRDRTFRAALRQGMFTTTLGALDRAVASTIVRNEAFYPFSSRIGYKNAESYWVDSGSFRLVRFISVPFLQLTAQDDVIVYWSSRNKLGYCVANPNVMVVETRCGGHLGWQESPTEADSSFGISSWADVATADFFDAIMEVNEERAGSPTGNKLKPYDQSGSFHDNFNLEKVMSRTTIVRSKL